jgi:hypothetical protein
MDWLFRLVMMAVTIIILIMLVRVYTNRDADAPELHRATYLYRLYYDDIIMYSDPVTGRVYPGVIDLAKFNDGALNNVFVLRSVPNTRISSKLILTPERDCLIPSKTIYNNKEVFERNFFYTATMKGGNTKENFTMPVTVRESRTCAANLLIHVVRSNS